MLAEASAAASGAVAIVNIPLQNQSLSRLDEDMGDTAVRSSDSQSINGNNINIINNDDSINESRTVGIFSPTQAYRPVDDNNAVTKDTV